MQQTSTLNVNLHFYIGLSLTRPSQNLELSYLFPQLSSIVIAFYCINSDSIIKRQKFQDSLFEKFPYSTGIFYLFHSKEVSP